VAPPSPAPLPRVHRGFYLRAGAGIASFRDEASVTGRPDDLHLSGYAWATDLAVGSDIAPGLALLGTFVGHMLSDPHVKRGPLSGNARGALMMNLFGFGFDWHPDVGGGFHVGGMLGPAVFKSWQALGELRTSTSARGFGGALHAGYDVWVTPPWSIGIGLRGTYARTSVDSGDTREKDSTRSLAIVISGVYY
jgi:hypothetical protein